MKSHLFPRVSVVVVCLLTIASAPSAAAFDRDSFAGEWHTSYGRMRLATTGERVSGTYAEPGRSPNRITGTVAGRKLTFSYEEEGAKGVGQFDLTEDGMRFDGRWRESARESWQSWSGKRVVPQVRDFSGVWSTDFGPMRLRQNGDQVEGIYQYRGRATVTGRMQSGALQLKYGEPDGATGTAEFTLSADGSAFSGNWRADGSSAPQPWSGRRIEPQPSRQWLVVFEARWEENLREAEYSYGEMPRQFFTRVPSVAVRHRTFTSREDFARWAADLPYFAEPVVLYVSSHGDEKGITVGDDRLDGKFIGELLRDAPSVKLVHLGACLAMSGAVPRDLRESIGPNAPPISGFTRVADWAGSAVIDFTYLDLVLTRSLPPSEAVRAILQNISFASDRSDGDAVIAPAGLKIVE